MSAAESTALTRAPESAENGEATAVTDEETTAIATVEARQLAQEIEQIKQAGKFAIEKKRVINTLNKMVQGLTWGSVHGVDLSPAAQYALAEMCYTTGANPIYHIDLFNGKPGLNAKYYQELANQHPHFVGYSQRQVAKHYSDLLHRQAGDMEAEAATLLKDAEGLEMPELRDAARGLRIEAVAVRADARQVERLRAHFGIPEEAQNAYETTVERYAPDAPLDAIRSGDIDGTRFIQVVREANWAGGKKSDPVGDAHSDRTARTRSLRRALEKAFAAWMEPRMKEIRRYERQIEANFRVLASDRIEQAAELPSEDGPQAALIGAGEPRAANGNGAKSLPVEDENGTAVEQPEPATSAPEPERAYDPNLARREFFGDFNAVGLAEADRKKWAVENGLPESTKVWTPEHHAKALDVLRGPDRQKLSEGAKLVGVNPEQLARKKFEKGMLALTVKELRQLNDEIAARADAASDGRLL